MPPSPTTDAVLPIAALRTVDLQRPGVVFASGRYLYRTGGEELAHGGMSSAYLLDRWPEEGSDADAERVVGKVLRPDYLRSLDSDPAARRDQEMTFAAQTRIATIAHPGLLSTYAIAGIADNYLTVAPLMGDSLWRAVSQGGLPPAARVQFLLHALHGLAALHKAGILHRDFTLRNILLDPARSWACLFDFDLAVELDEVGPVSYAQQYRGRIFGSAGYSVAPELLDPGLMERPLSPRLDIYAAGTAVFALFTDALPCGPTEDMWSLLLRTAEGLVHRGNSHVWYPDSVPPPLRDIIDRCLEHDPDNRPPTVEAVIAAIEERIPELQDNRSKTTAVFRTMRSDPSVDRVSRIEEVHRARRDASVSQTTIYELDTALARYGYFVQRSLGRVKSHPIFMAAPIPELLVEGTFPDANTYPKIVTSLDLRGDPNRAEVVSLWMSTFLPILRSVRQGVVTALYRAQFDEPSGMLLLFSEYVDDARFGTDLDDHPLPATEALALAFLIARQVGRLHEAGLAHNHIAPTSLVFKGLREVRRALPAMVGLVAPSTSRADMEEDVRRLAELACAWLSSPLAPPPDPRCEPQVEAARQRLAAIADRAREAQPGIDLLVATLAGTLSAIDGNFQMLREHGGDLHEYALLLIGASLYGRLWS